MGHGFNLPYELIQIHPRVDEVALETANRALDGHIVTHVLLTKEGHAGATNATPLATE